MHLLQTDPPRPHVAASEYLHREPWFTVRCDDVRLASGGRIPRYYVLEYPNWLNVVAVTTDNQLVLIRQYRHGIGAVHYELCAGVIEPGEDPLAAAQRELREETGFGGGTWQPWMELSANPGTHTNRTYSFLATNVVKLQPQALEVTEEISVHVVSPADARAIIDNGAMMQSLHLAPLLKWFLHQNR